jgi:hypothetical protein
MNIIAIFTTDGHTTAAIYFLDGIEISEAEYVAIQVAAIDRAFAA